MNESMMYTTGRHRPRKAIGLRDFANGLQCGCNRCERNWIGMYFA
jgi:hypothetical protein